MSTRKSLGCCRIRRIGGEYVHSLFWNDDFPRPESAFAPTLVQNRDFSYCHTLTGTELHRVNQFERTDSSFWLSSPGNVAHLAQNKFETILRKEADESTGKEGALLTFLKGYSVKQCSFTREHVRVRAESVIADSSHEAVEVECKFLIGADGANSTVRNALGIAMQGEEAMQHLVNVHFSCPGLRQLLHPRPAMLYFTFHEVGRREVGTYCCVLTLCLLSPSFAENGRCFCCTRCTF